jgi:hypothetical protein
MIKKFFKDITGITAAEEKKQREEQLRIEQEEAEKARKASLAEKRRLKKEENEIKKLSPKEIANKRKEPWVDVIGFKVNQNDIKNGFYELDWNSYFITQLKNEGYGYDGDPEEEIVDRWFRDICLNVAAATGIDMSEHSVGNLEVSKKRIQDELN